MKYMSFSSGIEAATVAWHELGWEPVLFSEIASFPSKLLNYYYPWVPNIGDMTKALKNEQFNNATADLIVAGTPCQSFSIAGLRKGLDSANGNLALWFCRILLEKQPPWFVWENVPGVFSSFSGEKGSKVHPRKVRIRRWKEAHITETSDFASILNAFRECGYSVAYRVLDSQYFGVPQRRRRVFVVGYLGNDWRPPAAVLFESESLRRDFTPSRKKGEEVAGTLNARTNGGGFPGSDGAMNGHVVATLDASYAKLQGASGQDLNHGHSHLVATSTLYSIMPQNGGKDYKAREVQVTQPLMAGGPLGGNQGGDYVVSEPTVFDGWQLTNPTNGSKYDIGSCSTMGRKSSMMVLTAGFMPGQGAKAGGMGYQENTSSTLKASCSGTNTVSAVFAQNSRDELRYIQNDGQITGALAANTGMKQQNYLMQPIYFESRFARNGRGAPDDIVAPLKSQSGGTGKGDAAPLVATNSIRRLTPLECERLQGFPDNYTNIPGASDSARYKAIGNSMTTHVMRWIGERIELVNKVIESLK